MQHQSISVSILMPVRNGGDFLEECLDSIIKQSYQQWELIVVNDHSDDHTLDILNEYASKDLRIRFHNNTGKGIIPALRSAYKKVRGKYITRMDADDIMSLDKLELLTKALLKSGPGYIATGLVKYFAAFEMGDGYLQYQEWLNELTLQGRNYQEIYKECVIASPAWMLHKTDLDLIGGFDSDIYPEDYDLIFRCYKNKLSPVAVPSVIHFWRDHSDRASRNDINYTDNRFTTLKVKYFLECDMDIDRELVLMGAGNRAKKIAKKLLENEIEFKWVCNNPNKIGHEIYGVQVENELVVEDKNMQQILIAIGNESDQKKIQANLSALDFKSSVDYFFLC